MYVIHNHVEGCTTKCEDMCDVYNELLFISEIADTPLTLADFAVLRDGVRIFGAVEIGPVLLRETYTVETYCETLQTDLVSAIEIGLDFQITIKDGDRVIFAE